MNYKIIGLAILSSIVIIFFTNISVALDCSKCHTTDPGKSSIKAKDTIEISENTCLKCHSPAYPPTPIGYNTHLVHVGKYSAKVNFLSRHPDVSKSINCGDCHKQIFDCRNCHVKGIPHIALPLGDNCQGCHGQVDNLFRHPAINLKIHNIFSLNSSKDCTMCHNPDNMMSFKLASGEIVPMEDSYKLCRQCHSTFYNQWNDGSHFVNKTPPQINAASYDYEGAGTDQNWEDSWKRENTCPNCHNPHNPSELYQLPAQNIEKVTNLPATGYMFIFGIMVGIFGAVFVFLKYKYTQLSNKMRKPSWLKLSLPKISLPKIPLPISITIEEPGMVEQVADIDNRVEEADKDDKKEIGGLTIKQENSDELLHHLVLGNALYAAGKYEDAIDYYDKSLQLDPENAIVWNNKALALTRSGKLDEAVACYDKAIKIEPDDCVFLNNKGTALYKKGNIKEAMKNYELAFKSNPESIQAKKGVEICLKSLKKPEKFKKFHNIEPKKKKSLRKNILFISCIFIIFGVSYIIFGAFLPLFTITSESMSPHIEKGDVIIYEDISRVNEINVYNNEKVNGYMSFENYGDVIIYKPFGGDGVPYVHRAMYYVEKGDEMWPGGPKAPHAGYITKGDNAVTNPEYDQQIRNSYLQPVKKEWIVGIAKYRIPFLGYIRMII